MTNDLNEIGKGAYAAIAEMVAALNVDYDRLEELRDVREKLVDLVEEAEDDETEGDEERKAAFEARATLAAWREENDDELNKLESDAGECKDRDDALERIQEGALCVEVRSGWTQLGETMTAKEFAILLTTGGPAVRIRGELSQGEPVRAGLEVQDWGTPWTEYFNAWEETLLTYARCFYYGG